MYIKKDFKCTVEDWCKAQKVKYNVQRIENYKDFLSLEVENKDLFERKVAVAIAKDIVSSGTVASFNLQIEPLNYSDEFKIVFPSKGIDYKLEKVCNLILEDEHFCLVPNFEGKILRVFFKPECIANMIKEREAEYNDLKAVEENCSKDIEDTKKQIEALKETLSHKEFQRGANSRKQDAVKEKLTALTWIDNTINNS